MKEKTTASLTWTEVQECLHLYYVENEEWNLMWIKNNCSPNALNKQALIIKTMLFLFVAYKKVEIVIFIAAADYSYKQPSNRK